MAHDINCDCRRCIDVWGPVIEEDFIALYADDVHSDPFREETPAPEGYDYAALGRLSEEVRQSILMLDDALHALRNDRSHITDEFIERTVERLRKAVSPKR